MPEFKPGDTEINILTYISKHHSFAEDLRGNLYLTKIPKRYPICLRKKHTQLLHKERMEAMEGYRSRMIDAENKLRNIETNLKILREMRR